jgi:homospermidine synthase
MTYIQVLDDLTRKNEELRIQLELVYANVTKLKAEQAKEREALLFARAAAQAGNAIVGSAVIATQLAKRVAQIDEQIKAWEVANVALKNAQEALAAGKHAEAVLREQQL